METTKAPNKRRGIYLSEELEAELVAYADRRGISFNEAIRTGSHALLELERRGVEVKLAGVHFTGDLPANL